MMATAISLPRYPERPRRQTLGAPIGAPNVCRRGFALRLLLAAMALNVAVYGLGLIAAATVHSAPDLALEEWVVDQAPGFELVQVRSASMARGIHWYSPSECVIEEPGYGMIDPCW